MLKIDTLIEKNFVGYLITSLNGHWLVILDCKETQDRSRHKDCKENRNPGICAVRPQQCCPFGKLPSCVGDKSSSCFIVRNWKVCHGKPRTRYGDRSNGKVNLLQNSTLNSDQVIATGNNWAPDVDNSSNWSVTRPLWTIRNGIQDLIN